MSIFLSCEEVKELTGVSRSKAGKTREQLQAAWLRTMKIPFYINAAGRPIVARALIEGNSQNKEAGNQKWEPAAVHG